MQNALYFNISTAKVIFLFEIKKNIEIFMVNMQKKLLNRH